MRNMDKKQLKVGDKIKSIEIITVYSSSDGRIPRIVIDKNLRVEEILGGIFYVERANKRVFMIHTES